MDRHPFAAAPFACHDIGLLAAALRDGTREWREELGEVDEDTIVWQPFPGGHSIGALILHMIDVEAWWIECMAAGNARPPEEEKLLLSEETKQYSVDWPVPPKKPLSWYLALQDEIRARTMNTLSRIEDPDRYIGGETWDRHYNVRWVVAHVVQHEAYHSGQAVLLQLLKGKLPPH